MSRPRDVAVFVGMPVYNAAAGLESALTSLLGQDYRELQILISDNGSTDRTYEIATAFANRDARVRVIRSPANNGPTWNFNTVLEASASYPFFMWAAHDDLWTPDYVSACMEALNRHPQVVLCATQARFVDAAGTPTGEVDVGVTTTGLLPRERALKYLQEVGRNSLFYGVFRRDAIANRRLRNCVGGDQLYLFDLSLAGEILTLPMPLLTRRIGATSRTAKSIYSNLGVRRLWPAKLFRLDVYRSFLKLAHATDLLEVRERRKLRLGILRVGLRRHVLPNLMPHRFTWWLRHGGTARQRVPR